MFNVQWSDMLKIGIFGVYYRIFLPILTFLVSLTLEIDPARAVKLGIKQQQLQHNQKLRAQVESTDNSDYATRNGKAERSSLEREILSEINRARTNPQAYAAWLQEQKQYYNGIVLKLPGEKPVRTNRGLKALAEAIDFLEQQEPLPNLTIADELSTAAASQLAQIGTTQSGENFKNISYGKVTAIGIVMHLIVDDGFPDRRHRKSIFNPNFSLAGIICQDDELYDNICAIAYEGQSVDIAAKPDVENSESSSESDITSNSQTLPQPPQPNSPPDVEVALESTDTETSDVEITEDTTDEDESNSANNDLPEVPEIVVPNIAANPESEEELETNNEEDSSEIEASDVEDNNESEEENASQSEPVLESDNNPLTANLLEQTKRGVLEEGDDTIPNDGSFYDSYPLQGNAGDSFIISLESQDFDTFVAILDSEGNILDQNDDIDDNNSNSRLRITLPSDGVFSIIVNAYDKGGKGRYILTVRR